jgi:hypothetical protein
MKRINEAASWLSTGLGTSPPRWRRIPLAIRSMLTGAEQMQVRVSDFEGAWWRADVDQRTTLILAPAQLLLNEHGDRICGIRRCGRV